MECAATCLNFLQDLALGNQLAGEGVGGGRLCAASSPTSCCCCSTPLFAAGRLAAPELPELLGEEDLAVGVGVEEADELWHGLLGEGFGHLGPVGTADLGRITQVLLSIRK